MTVKSVQAPIGGLNRRDSVDDMSEGDALILDNWIVDNGRCRLRGGSLLLANFSTDPIETLMDYGDQLLVATGDKIIESGFTQTAAGIEVGTPTTIGSGFSNAEWDYETYKSVLLMVNGVDAPQQWDGTTLTPIVFTSGITNPEELIGANQFKGRMFYWKNEPGFYYAEAGSYQGDLTYFDLSSFVSKKSVLAGTFQWSMDVGSGVDDFAVFMFNTGEILMYQGTDPSSIDYWALAGKYEAGEPFTSRFHASVAGDEVLLTRQGWVNFYSIYATGSDRDEGIGKKIVGMATEAAQRFGRFDGWEVKFFPDERLLLVNVPQGSGTFIQHVYSTNVGGWSTFSAWNSTTYGTFADSVLFGDISGNVHIGMYGREDNGNPITTDALPAFSYLSGRANTKQLTGVRPITNIDRPETIGINAASDYVVPGVPVADFVPTQSSASPWGSPWGSPWSAGGIGEAEGVWDSANEFGYTLTYRMQTVTSGQDVSWYSTAMMYKDAGVI